MCYIGVYRGGQGGPCPSQNGPVPIPGYWATDSKFHAGRLNNFTVNSNENQFQSNK